MDWKLNIMNAPLHKTAHTYNIGFIWTDYINYLWDRATCGYNIFTDKNIFTFLNSRIPKYLLKEAMLTI